MRAAHDRKLTERAAEHQRRLSVVEDKASQGHRMIRFERWPPFAPHPRTRFRTHHARVSPPSAPPPKKKHSIAMTFNEKAKNLRTCGPTSDSNCCARPTACYAMLSIEALAVPSASGLARTTFTRWPSIAGERV